MTEVTRLESVTGSYGEGAAPFDLAMRHFMMRSFEPWFRDGPALQVGCAHGDQTSLLVERFADLTVVEAAGEFIAHTRARIGARATYVQALVEDYAPVKRFETILFSHVLEHVEDPVAVLRHLGSLLTPTGRLFVVVPNAEAPSRLELDILPGVRHEWTPEMPEKAVEWMVRYKGEIVDTRH